MERHETVIIGGGQAGLAMSWHLQERGCEHLLIERDRLGGRWHSERWDSLHYQFPNWSLRLPGLAYSGDDPEGFSHYSAVVDFLAAYAKKVAPNLKLGCEVQRVRRDDRGFLIEADDGSIGATNVIVATGAFPAPHVPLFASQLHGSLHRLHSSQYCSPEQLPPGSVLVVGSGSSGGQIAEELNESGRQVFLSVTRHRRVPRRYLGKDMLWWFFELGWMDRTIDSLPGRKPAPAILLSGTRGGHSLNLRDFARNGVTLLDRMVDTEGDRILLAGDLTQRLAEADEAHDDFMRAAGEHAGRLGMRFDEMSDQAPESTPDAPREVDLTRMGVTSVIWCTGYRPAFEWVDVPVFDASGAPIQNRGQTACPGLFFLGLHWMHTFKSGALFGVGEDAGFLADRIVQRSL